MACLSGAREATEAAMAVGDGLAPRTRPGGVDPPDSARRRERPRGDRDSHTTRADAARTQTDRSRRVAGGHAVAPRGRRHMGGASLARCPRSGYSLLLSLLSDPDVCSAQSTAGTIAGGTGAR